MDSKYTAASADLGTSQELIAGLWRQGLDGLVGAAAEAKYRHYYVDNPAGTGICVVLRDAANAEAIGVQGLIPRAFHIGQRRISAAALADYVVVPRHRSLGPALLLMRTSIAVSRERFNFVYGTPNQKSRAILKRAGINAFSALTRYTKVIRSASYWRGRLPQWIVPTVAVAADALIGIVDVSRGLLYGRHLTWGERNSFGADFKEIWEARNVPDLVVGERSASALQWRYSSSDPASPWRLSIATDSSKTPMGYVIWRQCNGIAMVSDFFCRNVDSASKALLQSFSRYVRRFPVHRVSLEFFGCDRVAAALGACGFAARDQSSIVMVERSGDECDGPQVTSSTVFMTSFDRDHEI